jgi:acetyl-CoA acetyltransferase
MTSNPKGKFAITGLGMVVGPQPGRSARAVQSEAARLAIDDSGLEPKDIGGTVDLRRGAGAGERPSWSDAFPRVLGLPSKFYYSVGRGGALAGLGIMTAAQFLESGIVDYVVLAGAVDDWTKAQQAKQRAGSRGMVHTIKEGYWGTPFGDLRAVSHHSFFASRHMHEFGTTSEELGSISVQTRNWACLNPKAKMHDKPITLQNYLDSPILVYPYHLLDMCLVSDGAVAFVLTTAENAKNSKKPPVYVEGLGFGEAMNELWWQKRNYTELAVKTAKDAAFSQADIKLKDVNFAQLYDCFTTEVVLQLEGYGWAEKGKGGKFASEGHLGPGGDIPVNTSGGLLSAYHYGDLTGLSEAVLQLRGEAGQRQLSSPKIGIVTGHGGEIVSPGMCSTHTLLVLGNRQ